MRILIAEDDQILAMVCYAACVRLGMRLTTWAMALRPTPPSQPTSSTC